MVPIFRALSCALLIVPSSIPCGVPWWSPLGDREQVRRYPRVTRVVGVHDRALAVTGDHLDAGPHALRVHAERVVQQFGRAFGSAAGALEVRRGLLACQVAHDSKPLSRSATLATAPASVAAVPIWRD